MRIFKKIINKTCLFFIKLFDGVNNSLYTKMYIKFLNRNGMDISKLVNYIHSSVYFDGIDYSLIHIGDYSVISKNVILLTHDFSIRTGAISCGETFSKCKNWHFEKKIYIGNNVFIGMGSIILPGAYIEDNVIIGAGSIVRGHISANSVVVGNPGKKVFDLKQWYDNKKDKIINKEIFK